MERWSKSLDAVVSINDNEEDVARTFLFFISVICIVRFSVKYKRATDVLSFVFIQEHL